MARIFISYRRDDTEGFAGRIYDKLVTALGEKKIFMDIDNIPFGHDFVTVIQEEVGRCEVCLVLIGDRWLDIRDQNGDRRIDDPLDFVRLEVETALDHGVLVVPVLLRGARMPSPTDLPGKLGKLSRLNALKVGERFHPDLDKLVSQLEAFESTPAAGRKVADVKVRKAADAKVASSSPGPTISKSADAEFYEKIWKNARQDVLDIDDKIEDELAAAKETLARLQTAKDAATFDKEKEKIDAQIELELVRVKGRLTELQTAKKAALQVYGGACLKLGRKNELAEEEA